jgi:bacterioferritin-associated ferredoxin
VCSCHAVSDREIRRLARAGASSPRAVAEACGAGTRCGGCRMTVAAILDEVEAVQDRRLSMSVSISAAPEAI